MCFLIFSASFIAVNRFSHKVELPLMIDNIDTVVVIGADVKSEL